MPVRMRGDKMYATVNERLEAAHGEAAQPIGIKSVLTEVCPAGQVTVVRATVTFADERVFVGMSEIKFDATSGADKDAPVECAETSAVGRALAFAGYYGSENGLAGAEEVRTVTLRQENRDRSPGVATRAAAPFNADLRPAPSRPAPVVHEPWPEPDGAPHPADAGGTRPDLAAMSRMSATPKQIQTLEGLLRRAHRPPPDDLTTMTRAAASELISDLIGAAGAQGR